MSEPAAASRPVAATALVRDSRTRRTGLLVVVAVMLFGGVRHLPKPGNTRISAAPAHLDLTPSVAIDRAAASRTGGLPPPTGAEVDAIGSLLVRYDALIRQVEAQAVRAPDPQVDSALAELRELRTRTYAAARRSTLSPAEKASVPRTLIPNKAR